MKTIDIVVPSFNEEETLPTFYQVLSQVAQTMPNYRFGYIFVDDGSSDRTLEVCKELAAQDPMVRYISFSRNFGKESAIYAGLKNSTGDMVILMDADLQHPPALIPEMVRAVDEEGYGACGAKRKTGFFSRSFVAVNNRMSQTKLEKGATDYMCMCRPFVDAVMQLSETQRFTKGLFAWVGFRKKWLDYEQPPRMAGRTKWNFKKLFVYATDGLTSFSIFPLRLVTLAGIVICLLSFVYILITLIQTLIFGIDVPGYVTTLVVLLFLGGMIILSVGILGGYIGRIFLESKERPIYIMEQTNIPDPVSGTGNSPAICAVRKEKNADPEKDEQRA